MDKRIIEVFSEGSPECEDVIDLLESTACRPCQVVVLDLHEVAIAARAEVLGLLHAPAIVVDEECCAGRAVEPALRREHDPEETG